MDKDSKATNSAAELLKEAAHLQAVESNPLNAEELAMFEMFEREGWSPERRRAYMLEHIKSDNFIPAAE